MRGFLADMYPNRVYPEWVVDALNEAEIDITKGLEMDRMSESIYEPILKDKI